MDAILWILLPVLIAAGSALLAFYIMHSRMEVAIAKEHEVLAETRAALQSNEKLMVEKVKAVEEETLRKAFDQFLGDFRVEERHYMRESKSLFAARKSLVLQERLFFRNIPLSNWVEHEMVVEEGGDLQKLAKTCSVFTTRSVSGPEEMNAGARLLRSGQRTA